MGTHRGHRQGRLDPLGDHCPRTEHQAGRHGLHLELHAQDPGQAQYPERDPLRGRGQGLADHRRPGRHRKDLSSGSLPPAQRLFRHGLRETGGTAFRRHLHHGGLAGHLDPLSLGRGVRLQQAPWWRTPRRVQTGRSGFRRRLPFDPATGLFPAQAYFRLKPECPAPGPHPSTAKAGPSSSAGAP